MNKVKIEGSQGYYQVMVNGTQVATISGSRGEYWLNSGTNMTNHKFIARFKYRNSLAAVKDFAKFTLSRVTAEEAANLSAQQSPTDWAGKLGYVHYNLRPKK